MTTTSNMNTKFEFRTKFKKLLNVENCTTIIEAFNKFCSFDSKGALEVLWRMTYSEDTAWEEVYKLGLDSKIISLEKVIVLRNELRYQYEEIVEDGFLQFYQGDDEKIKTAFAVLKNHSDTIVASKVCNSCMAFVERPEVERILFLLKNKKETFYFGGIRTLGFDMIESDYLKQFHIEIHNILEAMNNHIPFYMDESDEEEISAEKSTEEVRDEPNKENVGETPKKFKLLTPEELIIHKEVFESYVYDNDMNILVEIANLGFDLNEIMAKTEKIKNFIIAAENLS